MFGTENDDYDDDDLNEKEDKGSVAWIAGVIFLPAFIVGMLYYSLLRFVRLRFSVIASIVLFTQLVSVLMLWPFGGFSRFVETLVDFGAIGDNWPNLVWPLFWLSVFIGGFIGLVIIGWELREMRKNPHRLQLPGNWMYNFKFRRTPFELLKKKKIIQQLQTGVLQSEERAPLGLNEEGEYAPVYRYATEANKHSIVFGASGSGKAAHKDTLIPTVNGMKTVESVLVGEQILDENADRTTVIGKYQPMTEDHYLLTFNDGTEIKVCGDHQWTVERLNTSLTEDISCDDLSKPRTNLISTLSTREMFNDMKETSRSIFAVPVISKPIEYSEKKLLIDPYVLGAWLGDGDSFQGNICGVDTEVRDSILSRGYRLSDEKITIKPGKPPIYDWKVEGLREILREIGLASKRFKKNNSLKDIPDDYLYSSREQRIDLLKGLLDTAGSAEIDGSAEIGMTNEKVIRKARQIVCSLGWHPTRVYRKVGKYTSKTGERVECKPTFSFSFVPAEQVFTVKRKAERLTARLNSNLGQQDKRSKRYVTSITPIQDNPEDYYCFEVDSKSHLYLATESFIPTHNTITLQSMLLNDINNSIPLILIDMKRSPEFASKLAKWTSDAGGDFYHFVNGEPEVYDVPNSPGQAFYDPLKSGSSTSKADMVLGMREYDAASAVYRAAMQQLLQVLFSALRYANRDSIHLKEEGYITVRDFDMQEIPKGSRETFPRNNLNHFVERDGTARFCEQWVRANPKYLSIKGKELLEATHKEYMKNTRKSWTDAQAAEAKKDVMRKILQDYPSILIAAGILEEHTVNKIDWTSGGIYQVYSATKPGNMDALAKACSGTPIQGEIEDIAAQCKGRTQISHALEELRGQMRTIVASEYGQWLKLSESREKNIDLFAMTQKPGTVILFSLNSDSEPDFAKYVGSMIMADLTATSAKRRNAQLSNQVNVYIDEFQAINPSSVAGLLEKSRESKIAMTLAQQSAEQVVASTPNNGEAYLQSILDTCSNFIIHAGSTEDSAERFAKILGKEWVDSYRASNKNKSFFLSVNWSNKRKQTVMTSKEEQWRFAPSKFMSLSSPDKNNGYKSTAVILNKTCSDPLYRDNKGGLARTVWMIPDSRVLEKYYTPKFLDSDSTPSSSKVTVVVDDSEDEWLVNELFAQESVRPQSKVIETFANVSALRDSDYEDDEDTDGGYEWEELPDDEDPEDEEELTLGSIIGDMNVEQVNTKAQTNRVSEKQETFRPVSEQSSFMNFKEKGLPRNEPKPKEVKPVPPASDFELPDIFAQ